jgi:LuxR family maltose regulon positive regulatory protein
VSELLNTKLFMPPARQNLVPRPRLLDRLERGLANGRPLTLIAAPAGYGKTTLLSAWLAGHRPPAAWLSLDEQDNDPARFWTGVVAALQTAWPGIGRAALDALQSPQPPAVQMLLPGLLNDIGSLGGQTILVLDDYHLMSASGIHDSLAFVLLHAPASLHVVISTRTDPPLPIARLRARGALTEIRAADLRFNADEAASFLRQVMGLELAPGDVALLETRTEGWITGLHLAALSLQGANADKIASFVAGFGGSNRYIMDYLIEEVLSRQPDQVRDLLVQTSILERFCASLISAVVAGGGEQSLAPGDCQAILDYAEKADLLIVPLDDQRCWYRYHGLFADVLRNRLASSQPDRLPALHRRAAAWHEQEGYVAQAIKHALAGGDRQHAIRIVEQNGMPAFMRGEAATLGAWLRLLGEAVGERPRLCLCQAWVNTLAGEMDAVEPFLQAIDDHLLAAPPGQQTEEEDLLGQAAAIRGFVAYFRGDAARAIQYCQQALASLRPDSALVRGLVTHALGEARRRDGDVPGAIRANAEAARLGKAAGSTLLTVSALSSLGNLMVDSGRLRQAAASYNEALQAATLSDGARLPAAGRAYACMGRVYYEWNDLDKAAHCAEQGIELAQRVGAPEYSSESHAGLARVRLAQGDVSAADALLREAERLSVAHEMPATVRSRLAALRLHVWLAQGQLETAGRMISEHGLSAHDDVSPFRELEYLALARVLVSRGDLDAASALLDRLLHMARAAGLTGRVIEALALQALVLRAQGRAIEARQAVQQALALAEPEGYVRTFLDLGAGVQSLLTDWRSHSVEHSRQARLEAYVDQLLGAEPRAQAQRVIGQSAIANCHAPIAEPLSARELEVLRLVAAGKSNSEIAAELVVATGTVKRHLNNIFGKLGAQSRTQCVARARDLHLL